MFHSAICSFCSVVILTTLRVFEVIFPLCRHSNARTKIQTECLQLACYSKNLTCPESLQWAESDRQGLKYVVSKGLQAVIQLATIVSEKIGIHGPLLPLGSL